MTANLPPSYFTFGPSWAYISAHRANSVDEDTVQVAAVRTVYERPRSPSETYKTPSEAQRAADAVKGEVETRWGAGCCETRVVRYPGTKPVGPGRRADRYVPVVVMVAARAMDNAKRGAVDEYVRHLLSPSEELRHYIESFPRVTAIKVVWAPICPWV